MAQLHDSIDVLLAAWKGVRPDLDVSPMELVGRVIVLAQHLERSVEEALEEHDLSLGQFDILATLRRHGNGMTPTELLQSVVLSSGGMTSRLDRLEEDGIIARKRDPNDRRGVIVELTAKGKKLIDRATTTRFENASEVLPKLSATETKQLISLLRRWLVEVQ
ncbi:MAG: MarR family winged helix-turn-helix transcriptional regulator [Fimbriiglobus sp.]